MSQNHARLPLFIGEEVFHTMNIRMNEESKDETSKTFRLQEMQLINSRKMKE